MEAFLMKFILMSHASWLANEAGYGVPLPFVIYAGMEDAGRKAIGMDPIPRPTDGDCFERAQYRLGLRAHEKWVDAVREPEEYWEDPPPAFYPGPVGDMQTPTC